MQHIVKYRSTIIFQLYFNSCNIHAMPYEGLINYILFDVILLCLICDFVALTNKNNLLYQRLDSDPVSPPGLGLCVTSNTLPNVIVRCCDITQPGRQKCSKLDDPDAGGTRLNHQIIADGRDDTGRMM